MSRKLVTISICLLKIDTFKSPLSVLNRRLRQTSSKQDAPSSVKSSLLGDWIGNEETINSTRNTVSSLNIFHVLLDQQSSIPYSTICF